MIVAISARPRRRCTGRGVGFESRPISSEDAGLATVAMAFRARDRGLTPCLAFFKPSSTSCFRYSGGFESRPVSSEDAGLVTVAMAFRAGDRGLTPCLAFFKPPSTSCFRYSGGFDRCGPPSASPRHRSPALRADIRGIANGEQRVPGLAVAATRACRRHDGPVTTDFDTGCAPPVASTTNDAATRRATDRNRSVRYAAHRLRRERRTRECSGPGRGLENGPGQVVARRRDVGDSTRGPIPLAAATRPP